MNTADRIAKLRVAFEQDKVDALLVSSVTNVSYLSGFSGDDSLALVTPDSRHIITDFRYVEQVGQECPGWEIVQRKKDLWTATAELLRKKGVRRLGFETAHLSVRNHAKLAEAAGGVGLVGLEGRVEKLREVKEPQEVKAIEAALQAQEAAFREIMAWVKPGQSEKEIARELEARMQSNGADCHSFETIVAAAERGSLPHARPTERVVQQGDALLIDWGARRFFYSSDLTRCLYFGTVTAKFEQIYSIVKQAQAQAFAVIRPGARFCDVDGAARGYIRDRGFGEQFGHSLGHGVGLEVHEAPVCSKDNEQLLEPGMVFTVEPGIYIPGWGGVRIEDMVLVTSSGMRVLSTCEKDLSRMIL